MKALVIYGHPNPASLNAAIKDRVVETLRAGGHEVSVRDLYKEGFDPVLAAEDFQQMRQGKARADVAQEQAAIRAADLVVFVFPIWWFNLPAVLKGYVDRVLSYGFAYAADPTTKQIVGLLKDKKAVLINTTGGPEVHYEQGGMRAVLTKTVDEGIFAFCGMKVVLHQYLYGVVGRSREDLGRELDAVAALVKKLFSAK